MPEHHEEVILRFDGGLASRAQMHLYEYSRAQYGFARILTTVEQFRRTGKIIDKVSKHQRVDLIVSAPRAGSFQLDIKVAVLEASEAHLQGVPFELLFALVLDRLVPKGEEYERLIKRLASIQRRDAATPEVVKARLSDIEDGEPASTEEALGIVTYALNSNNPAIGRAEIEYDELRRMQLFLESDKQRSDALAAHAAALQRVDFGELDKLVAKVRPIFNEVSVPFQASATSLTIGTRESPDRYYRLDPERLGYIRARRLDETPVSFRARIKSYDRETAVGRMRSDEFKGAKSFQVDPDVREVVQPRIIEAMNRRDVTLSCVRYTDANGIVTSYIVRDVTP